MTTTRLLLAFGLALGTGTLAREARANGDGSHGVTLLKEGRGIRAAAFGVGLAGRRPDLSVAPVTTANIEVGGLPSGAVVEHAYLYWIVYAAAANPNISLQGVPLTGTLIGTSAATCWANHTALTQNFALRAEVTSRITGNGVYTLTGFPSGTADADTQGATLFLVYRDPAVALNGGVVLRDGSMTLRSGSSVEGSFDNLSLPASVLSARFMLSAGDGQSGLPDGTLRFELVAKSFDGHWTGSAGNYWDVREYDVLAEADPQKNELEWTQNFSSDCVAFPYSALTFQSPEGTVSGMDAGVGDAGSTDGSASNDGGANPGANPGGANPGGADQGGGSPNDATPEGVDAGDAGCGCVTVPTGARTSTGAIVAAALLASWTRRRRRGR